LRRAGTTSSEAFAAVHEQCFAGDEIVFDEEANGAGHIIA